MRYDITMVHVTIFLPLDHIKKKLHLNRQSMYYLYLVRLTHTCILYAICRLKLAPITITRADYKFKNQFKYFIICFSSLIHSIHPSIDRSLVRSFVRLLVRMVVCSVQIVIYRCFALSAAFINCMYACLNYIIT